MKPAGKFKRIPEAVFAATLAGGLAISAMTAPANAGSATDWVQNTHASIRLIADDVPGPGGKKILVAGVHIKLDDGWKTYWRTPGDAGLPPLFEWKGSGNLKNAKVLWPAPVRFHDSAGTSFGYKHEVVFPVLIEPESAGKPVDLRLKMEFAVCDDICIPAEASFQLKADEGGFFSTNYAPLLTRYMKRVPSKTEPGSSPSVTSTEADLSGSSPYLAVETSFPGGADGADLFIEGPEGFYLPPSEPVGKTGENTMRFKVDLTKGDDPKALKGKTLTLTLVSKQARAETSWQLD